ncbi:MAG: DUF5103 domain-containing protein [Bacteroidetes bacterium]|nr:DUF5103 domain-containing protein [Bacteroidota bacterium]
MKKSILFGLLAILTISAKAQKVLQYTNFIYEPQFHTVLLYKPGSNVPTPVMNLNSQDQLQLSFDELVTDNDYYQFTFIHCDANWNPSNLRPMQYIEGNLLDYINDFKYSSNTYQKYVHYSVNFPSRDMRPKLSGNYILKVYRNYDEQDIVITRRFFVVDNRTSFNFDIHPATLSQYRFSKQEVDFKATINEYRVVNPYTDLKVVISQNNRWDNAVYGLHPLFIVGNEYTYNYEEQNLFDGTNEYRFFDSRSLRFLSQNVMKKTHDTLTNLYLYPADRRGSGAYVQYKDFDGKRVIANKDGQNDGSFDGDYTWVYFTFRSGQPLLSGDVYVMGELSGWRANPLFRLEYNPTSKSYEGRALLKQGYYSYLFVTLNTENGVMETYETEGNYMNTENQYYIYMYCKNQNFGYDELIGYVSEASNTNNNR